MGNLRTILAEEGMVTKEGTLDDDSLSRLLDPEAVESTQKIIQQISHKGNGGLHFLGAQLEALAVVEKQLRATIKTNQTSGTKLLRKDLLVSLEEITDDYPFRRWAAIGREIADTLENIEDLYVKLQ